MRRRRYYILGALVLAGVLAFWIFSPTGPAEPSYEGLTLSEWLNSQRINTATGQPYRSEEAFTRALDQMGPDAIPFLVKYIRNAAPPWRNATYNYLANHFPNSRIAKRVRERLDPAIDREWYSACAFELLGSRAESAVPLLAGCLDRRGSALLAAKALVGIGEKGFPPILAALTNQQTECTVMLTAGLNRCRTNVDFAMPALIQNQQSTNAQLAAMTRGVLNYLTNNNGVTNRW